MTTPLVGIVGCSGAVGRAAAGILAREGGVRLRGGSRRALAGNEMDGVVGLEGSEWEWMAVDAEDARSLARFCDGCRIVLNCAGPSCLIGDRVARAAAACGADYVDAFGALRIERQLAEWTKKRTENRTKKQIETDAAGRRFIVSAGAFPGLTGIFSRWLARGFERIDRLRAFVGGREHCSPAAGADVLLSTLDGFGTPGAAWIDGRVAAGVLPVLEDVEIPGFPCRVWAHPFLSREMEETAAALKIARIDWYNVASSPDIPEAIGRACGQLSSSFSAAAMGAPGNRLSLDRLSLDGLSLETGILAQAVAGLTRTAALEMAGRTPFHVISMEISGLRRGRGARLRGILRGPDSYRMSGMVAASSVRCLLEQPSPRGGHIPPGSHIPPGVHRAASVLDPAWLLERIAAFGIAEPHLADLPPAEDTESPVEEAMEEGTI